MYELRRSAVRIGSCTQLSSSCPAPVEQCPHDRGLPGEDFLSQHPMHLFTPVRASIGNDHELVVHISGPAYGRKNNTAGGDAEQDQRRDVVRTQDRKRENEFEDGRTA